MEISNVKNLWHRLREYQSLGILIFLFFNAMSVFWVLKPIRKSLFIGYFKENPYQIFDLSLGGAQVEQLAKLSMVAVALIVALTLPRLTKRFTMRDVLVVVSAVAAAGLGISSYMIGHENAAFVWSFYLFGDFINSLLITILWMLLHNSVNTSQAKKIYSAVGIGIVGGGVFGSFVLYQAIDTVGREAIVGLSIIPVALIGTLGYYHVCRINRKGGIGNCGPAAERAEEKKKQVEFFVKRGTKSSLKYWAAIALLVGLYEVSSGIIDFQLSVAVENVEATGFERDKYFGLIGQVQSVIALLVQVFVTGWLIERWGLGVALLILPFATLFGSVGFLLIPTLSSAMILSVSDNALNYSVNQSAKETLYVPTEKSERNRAKPLIDLFVQRFAKSFAIGLNLILVTQVSLENVRWLSLLAITVMISWIFIARFTSREFERFAHNEPKPL